jgi:hypothetical protein
VEETLRVLIPFLFFAMLVGGLQVIEYQRRRSAAREGPRPTGEASAAPAPGRLRLPARPASEPPPREVEPGVQPRRPASGSVLSRKQPAQTAASPLVLAPARVRIRRLLREPGGRRVAILAQEVLGPPVGLRRMQRPFA